VRGEMSALAGGVLAAQRQVMHIMTGFGVAVIGIFGAVAAALITALL
jgi:hypothetical protein